MGCLSSKNLDETSTNNINHELDQQQQKMDSSENETGRGSAGPAGERVAAIRGPLRTEPLSKRRLQDSSEGSIKSGSFGGEEYHLKINFIISSAAGAPHRLSADAVREKIQQIRDELDGHENEIVTKAEKDYFIEQRCWDFLFPDNKEIFMVYRPKNTLAKENLQTRVPACKGCAELGQSMSLCPWTVSTACPIFYHEMYDVRFGYEVVAGCPECAEERKS